MMSDPTDPASRIAMNRSSIQVQPSLTKHSSWTRWYRRALPAYWVFLFCVTHFPRLEVPGRLAHRDKLLHLVAYGVLACLFWRFCGTFIDVRRQRFVIGAAAFLVGYAALDEFLQAAVGRSASLADWLFDVAGILGVLGVLYWTPWRASPTTHRAKAGAPRR